MAAEFSKTPAEGEAMVESFNVGASLALSGQDMPSELPLLPMRNIPVFPGVTAPVAMGRASSVRLIEEALADDRLVRLIGQRDPAEDAPTPATLYSVGAVACIVGAQRQAEGAIHLLV